MRNSDGALGLYDLVEGKFYENVGTGSFETDPKRFNVVISTIPSQSGTLTYTGSTVSPGWKDYDSTAMTISGQTNGVNAGDYTATFTPNDGYCWSDGTKTAKTVSWSIGKATNTLTMSTASMSLQQSGRGTRTASAKFGGNITATSSNTSAATVSYSNGTITVTAKGKGSSTITVYSASTSNYNSDRKTFTVSVTGVISTVPSQSGTLTYTGNTMSPGWKNYDSNKMTISGQTNGVNAGSYTAKFTPRSGYKWSDGTTTAKSVTWSIGKATNTLTVTNVNTNLTYPNTSTWTASAKFGGTITATSSNTSVATVSVSGGNVTVRPVDAGTTTIKITSYGTSNYNAQTTSYNVTVTKPEPLVTTMNGHYTSSTTPYLGDTLSESRYNSNFTTDLTPRAGVAEFSNGDHASYQVYVMKFTTTDFVEGTDTSVTFNLSAKKISQSNISLRYALCSSISNIASYTNKRGPVSDGNQIVSGVMSFSGLTSDYSSYSEVISTTALKPNTTYYLVLWADSDTQYDLRLNTLTNHSIVVDAARPNGG